MNNPSIQEVVAAFRAKEKQRLAQVAAQKEKEAQDAAERSDRQFQLTCEFREALRPAFSNYRSHIGEVVRCGACCGNTQFTIAVGDDDGYAGCYLDSVGRPIYYGNAGCWGRAFSTEHCADMTEMVVRIAEWVGKKEAQLEENTDNG
jgi:hypothetical protein